ncbi:hypothetical protein SCB29_24930 [Paraburkholderia sp. SIMBA_055]
MEVLGTQGNRLTFVACGVGGRGPGRGSIIFAAVGAAQCIRFGALTHGFHQGEIITLVGYPTKSEGFGFISLLKERLHFFAAWDENTWELGGRGLRDTTLNLRDFIPGGVFVTLRIAL